MTDRAVCNSSCLIALARIGRLDILRASFKNVIIPSVVKKEIGRTLNWVSVEQVKNRSAVNSLSTQLHDGESEVIAFAMERKNVIVVIDDKKARRIAKQLGLKVIGTVGLLLRAKKKGLIREIKPVMDALQQVDFRISDELYNEALRLAKEPYS
jgi:hypothetical protein